MDIARFIDQLPKAEVHLHMEGAVPWSVVRELDPTAPATLPSWAEDFRFRDWAHFGEMMRQASLGYTTHHNIAKTVTAIFDDLVAQNVRYVEMSFGADRALRQGYGPLQTIVDTIRAATPDGLTVCLIAGLARAYDYTLDDPMIQELFQTEGIAGIDLHAYEPLNPAHKFTHIYDAARERGWLLKAHAGEKAGAESIRDTLDSLKVKRIQHGTTAIEDDALMHRLVEEGVTLDLCPTSNVKLGVVASYATHPLKDFMQRGIRCTINTDDPMVFGCTLTSELKTAVICCGLSLADIAQTQRTAFENALMPDEKRQAILHEIDALVTEATH